MRGPPARAVLSLFEHHPDAIVFVSPQGRVLAWNPAAERMFGWSSREILGERLEEPLVIQPGDAADLEDADGSIAKRVMRRKRRDGTAFEAEIMSTAVYDDDGEISGYVSVIRDITEEMLIAAATAAIGSELDPTQAVGSFARVLSEVMPFAELSLTVLHGSTYRRLVSVGDVPADDLSAALGDTVPVAGNPTEQVLRTRSPLVVEDTLDAGWAIDAQLSSMGIRSYVIIPLLQDDRVFATFNVGFRHPGAATPAITKTLQALATAVSTAVKNILAFEAERDAVQRLEELDVLKNEFLAMVSHDLRNPLSVINGFAETLISMWDRLDDQQRLNMIAAIERNASALARLVERDLDVALIESGRFTFKTTTFDLGRLVQATVEDVARANPSRAYVVEIEPGLPHTVADEERSVQVILNLLSNAVKYSPEGSEVTVEVLRTELGVEVAIIDRGEGVPPEEMRNLFKKLSRLRGSRDRIRGTGLGLYISKALVEGMGGRIWCESARGRGATFRFYLPALGATPPAELQ